MPPTSSLGDEADEVAVGLTNDGLEDDAGVTWRESPSSEQPDSGQQHQPDPHVCHLHRRSMSDGILCWRAVDSTRAEAGA
jgi:hypothetical protein